MNLHVFCVKTILDILASSPIDHWAIARAANSGHVTIVEYLLSINAPITGLAISLAQNRRRLELIKYLLLMGAPCLPWNYKIKKIRKKLRLEINLSLSEFIGPDISSIILQKLVSPS